MYVYNRYITPVTTNIYPSVYPMKIIMWTQLIVFLSIIVIFPGSKFMGPTWGPPGSCRPQVGPMLVPWTLLSGLSAPSVSCDESNHNIKVAPLALRLPKTFQYTLPNTNDRCMACSSPLGDQSFKTKHHKEQKEQLKRRDDTYRHPLI